METYKFFEEGQSAEFDAEKILDQTEKLFRAAFEDIDLRRNIRIGAYSHVVGVDTSGRLPALIFSAVARQYANIGTYFVVGHRMRNQEYKTANDSSDFSSLDKFIENFHKKAGSKRKKVVIVDDVIDTGSSIRELGRQLEENKIQYDIFALAANANGLDFLRGSAVENLFMSENTKDVFPEIYGKSQISGVIKGNSDRYAKRNPHQIARLLKFSRARVAQISSNIIRDLERDGT